MNNDAQFHVLEAVISVGIIFISLAFVSSQLLSTPPSVEVVDSSTQLKLLCDEALYILWQSAPSNYSYENKLAEYILTNDTSGFCDALSSLIPSNVFYNVWVYDGFNRSLWYPDEKLESFGTIVVSHQVIVNNTRVYDVELEAWRA
ncbi:MAG TPA: hypothetical protein ENL13_01565 [Thermoplasmatales archaeon]|nr:hypothetical protein [Thermoplasmatales archaeon]